MKAYGITHRGAVRKENQDALRYTSPTEERDVLAAVLCDGMGGAQAGGLASTLAADGFMSHAANALDETSGMDDMKAILTEAVHYANQRVYVHAFEDLKCMGMGSTLVALLISGKRAVVANVGDSRAYLLAKNRVMQLTCDHSLMEDMVARGKLTREEARTHPKRNIITRAVGVEASVKADLTEVKFPPGSRILLCSDGLTNLVPDSALERVLCTEEDPERACNILLEQALQGGAPDNVTVFIAQH
ncbi:MAG: Stp1/IreP family PP2C-type Ser/Thr phosphatase [Oscillospiraceae bacterium]|nr:Stp1/IreP family PP2C-type Ser/Thr phosphatase [Oscillospiraceae bacterium]